MSAHPMQKAKGFHPLIPLEALLLPDPPLAGRDPAVDEKIADDAIFVDARFWEMIVLALRQ